MAFYQSPKEMFGARAEGFLKEAKRHWAMAKSGKGAYHYSKAKSCYAEAARNLEKAAQAVGKTFRKR